MRDSCFSGFYQEMNLQFLLEGLSNVDFQAWWRQQSFFFWFALCPSVTRLTDVTCRYHYLRNSYYENSNFFPKKNCLFLKWNLWNHADIWRNSKRKRRGRKVTGFLALYTLSNIFINNSFNTFCATDLSLYPWKHQKTRGFLMLSGGIERDQRHEMVIKNKNATIEYLNFSVDKPHKDYCETRLARKQNSNN